MTKKTYLIFEDEEFIDTIELDDLEKANYLQLNPQMELEPEEDYLSIEGFSYDDEDEDEFFDLDCLEE